MLKELKREVYEQNLALVKSGLSVMSLGSVSAIDRDKGVVVVKPSGVPFDDLTADDMIVIDLMTRKVVGSKYTPAGDTPTHLYLYDAFKNIGGIVQSHSTYAVAWAQAGVELPVYGTTHATSFYGKIPCTRALTEEEVKKDYEKNIGKVIAETFASRSYEFTPAVLVKNHRPFTWGRSSEEAVRNAIALEEVARMAKITRDINPSVAEADAFLVEKYAGRRLGLR